MQGEESVVKLKLEETHSEGFGHPLFSFRGIIQRGTRTGDVDKAGEGLNPHLPEQASQGGTYRARVLSR